MCYDSEARPPVPPTPAGNARGEDLVLTAANGNQFAAYAAYPEHSKDAQVLIFPDVRGLHQFYKDLALRFAEQGIGALAIDYFGRTAGLTPRDDSFDFWPHVQQIQFSTFQQDVKAGLDRLREGQGANNATFTLGFCMGGSFSFLTGTQPNLDLAGVIGFYAGLTRALVGNKTVLDVAQDIKYPVLGLFGGADPNIPVSVVEEFKQKLNEAHIPNQIVIYPNAPHSFFDRRSTEFAEASAEAWRQVLDFIATYTHKVGASA
jgi:carboxymethylenebutenolidase